jgi:hypothetical protein
MELADADTGSTSATTTYPIDVVLVSMYLIIKKNS